MAGLDSAATDVITQAAPAPSALDEATLTRLVVERKLTSAQAKDVGLSAALFQLVGEDTNLASAIRSASFPRLGGSPTSTTDLSRLSVADWTRFFTSHSAALPAGATAKSMGATLAGRFAMIHPAVAITTRLPQADAGQVTEAVRDLAPLFQHNAKVVGISFAELATRDLTPSQIAKLQATHARLVQLTRAYPGLELATVIDDPRLMPAAKGETVARRIAIVRR